MDTINYLTIEQATELTDRISKRCEHFNYYMHDNEKESMADLLHSIGVSTSDIIDVSHLADNYAINAEIVGPSDYSHYENLKDDSLFSWIEENEIYYCYIW